MARDQGAAVKRIGLSCFCAAWGTETGLTWASSWKELTRSSPPIQQYSYTDSHHSTPSDSSRGKLSLGLKAKEKKTYKNAATPTQTMNCTLLNCESWYSYILCFVYSTYGPVGLPELKKRIQIILIITCASIFTTRVNLEFLLVYKAECQS